MPSFGSTSLSRLATCHEDLQTLMGVVVKEWDCTILCGRRSKEAQDAAYNAVPRRSGVKWPMSKHNAPCHGCGGAGCADCGGDGEADHGPDTLVWAVDVAPYYADEDPHVDWSTTGESGRRWYAFKGYVLGVADRLFAEGKMTHRVRVGEDWDGDHKFNDHRLVDLPHIELVR